MTKRRLLWVGDAGVSSGFARATHYTCTALMEKFDVEVIGLNYMGDKHPYPFHIYPAASGGDAFGLKKMAEVITKEGPSVVVVQNDPWNFPLYLKYAGNTPVIGAVAVDGLNCRGKGLNGLLHAIFWTQFGDTEARLGGFTGSSSVIPLGVDLETYHPMDKAKTRETLRIPAIFAQRGLPADAFIVGSIGRNQPRKRLDLTIGYFAEWVHSRKINDAVLWLHVAPTGEQAFNLAQLAEYYKITNRVIIPQIEPIHGISETSLNAVYNIWDTLLVTSQGEGFHLPSFEAMAAGVPVIAGDWSALAELLEDAAVKVHCSSTAVTPNSINTIGGIPDRDLTIHALDRMYQSRLLRKQCSERGLNLVRQDRYRWENIGRAFTNAVESALNAPRSEDITMADPVEMAR